MVIKEFECEEKKLDWIDGKIKEIQCEEKKLDLMILIFMIFMALSGGDPCVMYYSSTTYVLRVFFFKKKAAGAFVYFLYFLLSLSLKSTTLKLPYVLHDYGHGSHDDFLSA